MRWRRESNPQSAGQEDPPRYHVATINQRSAAKIQKKYYNGMVIKKIFFFCGHIVNVRVDDNGYIVGAQVDRDAVITDKRISIPFCQKNRCVNSQEREKPKQSSVDSREKACKTEPPSRQCAGQR